MRASACPIAFGRLITIVDISVDPTNTIYLELTRQIGHLLDRLARFMVLTHTGKVMPDNHARIITALHRGGPVAARKALRQVSRTVNQKILARIMAEESGQW
jgi:GntR family transcriptional regulator, rspAB operon transcriptional repressor